MKSKEEVKERRIQSLIDVLDESIINIFLIIRNYITCKRLIHSPQKLIEAIKVLKRYNKIKE